MHNAWERVDMWIWHGDGAMLDGRNKNQQENFVEVTLQILPLHFMKFSAKLIVLKSYLRNKFIDDNAVNCQ